MSIENLIAAHTAPANLLVSTADATEASYEVRMHDAKVARQERLNAALGIR
jgi:hypothetical protein